MVGATELLRWTGSNVHFHRERSAGASSALKNDPELVSVGGPFPSWYIFAYLYRTVRDKESSGCFLCGSSPSQVQWGLETESGGERSDHNFSQLLFIEMKVPSASQRKPEIWTFFFFLKEREVKFPDI